MQAVARFAARRGMPQYIRSDQGKNFGRARKEIGSLWHDMQQDTITSQLPDITWEFSTAYAPHLNGAVERIVGLTKRMLVGAIAQETSAIFNDEQFGTLVTKCEGILNSRPLTYVSSHPEDLKPITPNDFLKPLAARDLPPVSGDSRSKYVEKLQLIDGALLNAWNRFVSEYLPTLHRSQKWNKFEKNFQVGDIVMSLEQGPRHQGRYPLARIVRIRPDRDGAVRHVSVKIRNEKPVRRHIHSLVRLFPCDGPRLTDCDKNSNQVQDYDSDMDKTSSETELLEDENLPKKELKLKRKFKVLNRAANNLLKSDSIADSDLSYLDQTSTTEDTLANEGGAFHYVERSDLCHSGSTIGMTTMEALGKENNYMDENIMQVSDNDSDIAKGNQIHFASANNFGQIQISREKKTISRVNFGTLTFSMLAQCAAVEPEDLSEVDSDSDSDY